MTARHRLLPLLALLAIAGSRQVSAQTWTTLDYPGANFTAPQGVSGDAVVGVYSSGAGFHGFIYNGSDFTSLSFPGAQYTELAGISGGVIAGTYSAGGPNRGFLYNGSTFTPFDVPGSTSTIIYGISGSSVVGAYLDSAFRKHGFFYNGSTFTTLDGPDAFSTEAFGVSGNTVVGYYIENAITQGTRRRRGFVYDGTSLSTFDAPGAFHTNLYGISDGTIVGFSNPFGPSFSNGLGGGFFYRDSTFTPLSALFPTAPLLTPYGISGDTIVGIYGPTQTRGFIAIIPEPATLGLLVLLAPAAMLRRRLRSGCQANL